MAFIPALLNLILSLLEAFFAAPPKVSPDEDYSNHCQTPEQRNASFQAALDFFELSQDTLSRDSLKKKFRRYSLLHHPDRNGNTEESKQTMQKVNNFYNILNEELDRREGIHHDDEESQDEENQEPETPSPPKQHTTKQNHKKQSKSAKKRQRRRARQRQQTSMNEEMRKEEQEVKRQRAQVKREQQKMAKKMHAQKLRNGLDTQAGRDKAFREWKQAVNNMEQVKSSSSGDDGTSGNATSEPKREKKDSGLEDIDDNAAEQPSAESNKQSEDETTPTASVPVKPINLVMECCMKEVVIALRMGLTDAVIDRIQKDMEECVMNTMAQAYFDGQKEVRESQIVRQLQKFFVEPLDDDGNTLLHYAVYYENGETISAIYHLAGEFEAISEVFLATNRHGMIPLDFFKCCVKDSSVPERMKLYTDAARADQERKCLLPSLKRAARRLWGILCNFNVASLLRPTCFVGTYLIGTRLFGRSRIVSLLLAFVPSFSLSDYVENMELDDCRSAYAPSLFASHLTWRCYRYLIGVVPWMVWLVLVVIVIFAKGSNSWRSYLATALSLPLLLVFAPLFYIFDVLDKSIRFPAFIKRNDQLERACRLVVFAVGFLLANRGMAYYFGDVENDDDMLAGEEEEGFVQQEMFEESEIHTLFREKYL